MKQCIASHRTVVKDLWSRRDTTVSGAEMYLLYTESMYRMPTGHSKIEDRPPGPQSIPVLMNFYSREARLLLLGGQNLSVCVSLRSLISKRTNRANWLKIFRTLPWYCSSVEIVFGTNRTTGTETRSQRLPVDAHTKRGIREAACATLRNVIIFLPLVPVDRVEAVWCW